MEIEILTAESLGVRGLCCYIETKKRKILIDPGVALGYFRNGLLPHPFQVAVDERIKEKIKRRWIEATDIIFSHLHGDHIPLVEANPYQLSIHRLSQLEPRVKIWVSPPEQLNDLEKNRLSSLQPILGRYFCSIGSHSQERLSFSKMVFHGERNKNRNKVFMTRIEDDFVFAHGSDIQLLDKEAVQIILSWKPDLLIVSGPPLYLHTKVNRRLLEMATENALLLSKKIHTVIIDHHLLRNYQGLNWLREINNKTNYHVICAAEFMRKPLMMLEADRLSLYEYMPVFPEWHEQYAKGLIDPQEYWDCGKRMYSQKNRK